MADTPPVDIVGLHGGSWFGREAGQALESATVIAGSRRHLDALPDGLPAERLPLDGPLDPFLSAVADLRRRERRVVIVASGDPGFFGLTRMASARFGTDGIRVHPAPSSVALGFARLGVAWDDAVVLSAHGRPPGPAGDAIRHHPKVAVLTSPEEPPECLGADLLARGCGPRRVVVASFLGEPGEAIWEGDVAGLAAGSFEPLSVAMFIAPGPPADRPATAWGIPEAAIDHRGGMITKAEVRAVALGKMALPPAGVLWDVGAGSGSVSIEATRLSAGLEAFAVERDPAEAARLRRNLDGSGAVVVEGEAPAALEGLPDPDRVFVGGGGIGVLEAALARLRPSGVVVATYATLDRAAGAARRLGNVVQISVNRGVTIGESGSVRLAAENPVFICWGPEGGG